MASHQQVPAVQTQAYPIENTPNTRGEVLQTAVLGHTRLVTKVRISDIIKCMKEKILSQFRAISIWSGSG